MTVARRPIHAANQGPKGVSRQASPTRGATETHRLALSRENPHVRGERPVGDASAYFRCADAGRMPVRREVAASVVGKLRFTVRLHFCNTALASMAAVESSRAGTGDPPLGVNRALRVGDFRRRTRQLTS